MKRGMSKDDSRKKERNDEKERKQRALKRKRSKKIWLTRKGKKDTNPEKKDRLEDFFIQATKQKTN